MFGRRRLKAEIERLTYRVKELEEQLCPWGQHDYVLTKTEYKTWCSGHAVEAIDHFKCMKCGKEKTKEGWYV